MTAVDFYSPVPLVLLICLISGRGQGRQRQSQPAISLQPRNAWLLW